MSALDTADIPTIDVRTIPPFERHPRIFAALAAAEPQQSLMIIADHEPRPLQYQLQARFPGLFDWIFVEQGPEAWRVVITRVAGADSKCCCGS